MVEEEDSGKLHQMRREHGRIIPKTAHGADTWHLHPPGKGGQQGRGITSYLCGALTQGAAFGEMPSTGLPGGRI